MFGLEKLFNKDEDKRRKDKIAQMLKTSPELLEQFESEYRSRCLTDEAEPGGGFFDVNSRQASAAVREKQVPDNYDEEYLQSVINRAVDELISETEIIKVSNTHIEKAAGPALPAGTQMLSAAEVNSIEPQLRPMATGILAKFDLDPKMPTYVTLLENLANSLEAKTDKRKADFYNLFRQGLDMLDIDPITYKILGMNRNSMGYWLPKVADAVWREGFFKIPNTIIAKVPMSLLQLSRLDYISMTPTTLKIVDDWAMKVFELDPNESYFIKNGVFSSKFDFRNAKVTTEKEVRELGEYLLYIQSQASEMAHPLNQSIIYGAATTNEWVVREFIEDVEDNPTIYKGLPLHTEYRVFVDFDTDEVLCVVPYWEPETMKNRFANMDDAASPHQRHDYIVYKMHEETLMKRYEENKHNVVSHISALIGNVDLEGQWSIDIMQNGEDFWLIDMATASTSAFKDQIPEGKLKPAKEDWIPKLN
ncbi:MAG: hypothetical protein IJI14_14400 [Anaerolineaceae bacterium]|nr:hypothetical protein [Anaerolineaceae bacterium]